MNKQKTKKSPLHSRNKHRSQYDFPKLISVCEELKDLVFKNKYDNLTIDFADPKAVISLNKALLKQFYDINDWGLPEGYLCPPIPGRADYLHYVADLLAEGNNNEIPRGKKVNVLDIGTGSSCIYPLIGIAEYDWSFVGTDIDETSINAVRSIINANPNLATQIELRQQKYRAHIFDGVVDENEQFDLTICNPPFHKSFYDAQAGTKRKVKNLGTGKGKTIIKNFGGRATELWCKGGEASFIRRMIEESAMVPDLSKWFTTLVSKKETLKYLEMHLDKAKVKETRIIEMSQGQKTSRLLVWNFKQS